MSSFKINISSQRQGPQTQAADLREVKPARTHTLPSTEYVRTDTWSLHSCDLCNLCKITATMRMISDEVLGSANAHVASGRHRCQGPWKSRNLPVVPQLGLGAAG